jgi:hypothetical protein
MERDQKLNTNLPNSVMENCQNKLWGEFRVARQEVRTATALHTHCSREHAGQFQDATSGYKTAHNYGHKWFHTE